MYCVLKRSANTILLKSIFFIKPILCVPPSPIEKEDGRRTQETGLVEGQGEENEGGRGGCLGVGRTKSITEQSDFAEGA